MTSLKKKCIRKKQIGAIAQLGERCVRNAEVRGSIPLSSTIFFKVSMEKLFRYIQFGSGFGFKYVFLFVLAIEVLFSGFYGVVVLNKLQNNSEVVSFVRQLPVIKIKDGVVFEPKETKVSYEIPGTSALSFTIDTTQSDFTNPAQLPAGVTLTQKALSVNVGGEMSLFSLPEEADLTHETILQSINFFLGMMWVMAVVLIFVGTFLGFALTYLAVLLFFWVAGMRVISDQIARCSALSWMCILALDLLLVAAGFGFSLLSGVVLAVILSLFVLMRLKNDLAFPMEALKAMQEKIPENEKQKPSANKKNNKKRRFFSQKKKNKK